MAISTDGVVGYEISAKPFNTDKYILVRVAYHAWCAMHTCEFITKYKDVFNGKTILQDNVRFHHARRVKSYTTSNNIKMEYIPAYSPIFNPIEMVFSKDMFTITYFVPCLSSPYSFLVLSMRLNYKNFFVI